jgi:23S rRNA pseudouridine1911/1915/1917 synthase
MNRKPTSGPQEAREKITRLTAAEPSQLLEFLLKQLPKHGRNSIKALLAHRQVSINDRVATKFDAPLAPGQTVTVRWSRPPEPFPFVGLDIMYEDDALIVVQKDAGLLSIATEQEKELTAYRQLSDYVKRSSPGNRIFILHRLDRDTSGVMMFARSEKIQEALQTSWKDAVQERTYIALVEGKVKKAEGTISSWLKESKALRMYSSQRSGDGLHAVTHYKVRQASSEFSLLEIRLETGRKNQIRVHMEDIGHPIVGDKKYGSKRNAIGRLGLHANVLQFVHPVSGKTMRFESKLPSVFLRPFR